MSLHDLTVSEWRRIARLAERGDAQAIAKLSQLAHAVMDVREAFERGDTDAHEFAHEIVVKQTASIALA